MNDTLGGFLRQQRERRSVSVAELSRVTRIPLASLDAIENDRFDELPGEVFVRGFLKAYAQAIELVPDDVLVRYTSSRRVAYVTPLPVQTPLQAARDSQGRRFGVAIAFVLLLPGPAVLGALDRPQAARARHAVRALASRRPRQRCPFGPDAC